MNCTKALTCILLLNFLMISQSISQASENKKKQDFPLSISYNNHSWSFPFNSVLRLSPHYPGITIGTEINFRVREKSKLYQTIEFGGFLNNASGNGSYFNTNLAYRYTLNNGLMINSGLGLGIMKTYYINDTFLQTVDGSYQVSDTNGITGSSINLFIGGGYDFSKSRNKNLVLFTKYQWIASTGYWTLLPIRPSGLLHVGILFSLRK